MDISKAADKVKEKTDKIVYKGNPFLTGVFTNNTTFIACGYDKVPYVFKRGADGKWKEGKILDEGITKPKEAQIGKGSFEQSLMTFKKSEVKAASNQVKLDDDVIMKEMNTKHANYINCLKVYMGSRDQVQVLSTSDINGYINYWDVSKL